MSFAVMEAARCQAVMTFDRHFEVAGFRRVLVQHDGNVTRAAVALGLSRAMLQNKMKEYGLL